MKAKDVLKILNITRPTLTKYVKENKIKVDSVINGHYVYNDESVYSLIGLKKEKHASTNLITFVKDRINHDTLYHINDQKLRSLGWNPIHNIKDEIYTL